MATACRIGALTAGLPRSTVEAVTRYGERLGMVFQIVDDVLDVVATEEQLGKPAGNDLVEGVYTLPVIRAIANGGGAELRHLLGRPVEQGDVERLRALVRANGAVGEACDVARGYAAEAAASLVAVGDGQVAQALAAVGSSLVDGILT